MADAHVRNVSRFENKRRLVGVHLSNLLNLPGLSRESASDFRNLLDKVDITVASLNSLERSPEQLWENILVHIIVQKLDSGTRKT